MYKLRHTWTQYNIFSPARLHQLDRRVNEIDPNWPITPPSSQQPQISKPSKILINPAKFPQVRYLKAGLICTYAFISGIGSVFHMPVVVDPDPNFHVDADSDPDSDPDWHQIQKRCRSSFGSTLCFYKCWKKIKSEYLFYFYSQHCQFTLFCLSHPYVLNVP
jgi:hypothetical protein